MDDTPEGADPAACCLPSPTSQPEGWVAAALVAACFELAPACGFRFVTPLYTPGFIGLRAFRNVCALARFLGSPPTCCRRLPSLSEESQAGCTIVGCLGCTKRSAVILRALDTHRREAPRVARRKA